MAWGRRKAYSHCTAEKMARAYIPAITPLRGTGVSQHDEGFGWKALGEKGRKIQVIIQQKSPIYRYAKACAMMITFLIFCLNKQQY